MACDHLHERSDWYPKCIGIEWHTVSSRRTETSHEGADQQLIRYNNKYCIRPSDLPRRHYGNVQSPPNGRNGKTGVGRARTIGADAEPTASVAVAVTI